MNARVNTDRLWTDPQLRETEFALGVSPIPKHALAAQSAHAARFRQRDGKQHCSSSHASGTAGFEGEKQIDVLSLGWTIAIAIAVALTVYTSGG